MPVTKKGNKIAGNKKGNKKRQQKKTTKKAKELLAKKGNKIAGNKKKATKKAKQLPATKACGLNWVYSSPTKEATTGLNFFPTNCPS